MAARQIIRQRVDAVLSALLDGAAFSEICRKASEEWGVSERQICRYLQSANKIIEKSAKYRREEQIGLAVRRFTRIFSRAMKAQDYKTAIAAQREICTLFGLYKAQPNVQVNVAQQGDKPFALIIQALADEVVR